MIKLVLILVVATATAGVREYDLSVGQSIEIDHDKQTMSLKSQDVSVLSFGVCGEANCLIQPGQPIEVSYEVQYATHCEGVQGPDGWVEDLPHGSGLQTVVIEDVFFDTAIQMQCANNNGVILTETISLTIGYDDLDCSTVDPLPSGLEAVHHNYINLNDDFEFGENTNTDVLVDLDINEYAVLHNFTAPDVEGFRRRIDMVSPPTSHNSPEFTTASISRCPGDFSETAVCVRDARPFRTIRVSTNQADNPAVYCLLTPGQDYYLNWIQSPDPYNTPPSCLNAAHTQCALFYTETAL